jgi:signal transduction histidine kinase/AmiR/NasT family two-component response regulator
MRWRDMQGALLVFCCGLAVTALTAYKLADIERERDRIDFEKHATAARGAVLDRVQTCIALLRGTAGLIAANRDHLTAAAFRHYVGQLSLRQTYPGMLGIGWSRRIRQAELAAAVAALREEGSRDFHVWPAHPDADYYAIAYLEPLDERNAAAIGFDMASDPERAAAMERARDTGAPAATRRLSLVQEITAEKQPGFLLYVPVYRGGIAPESLEARRERLLGFVYAPLRAVDFLLPAFTHDSRAPITTIVYDGERRPDTLVFKNAAAAGMAAHPQFVQTNAIAVAGTPWTVVFESGQSSPVSWATTVAAIVAGTLLSVLLALVTWREAQAKALAAQWLSRERAARNDAERASAIKDEFLATLSHELRTPLNAILGWAHVVRSGKASEDQMRSGLDAIERNARVQVALIDELLDMSRIVSGKLQLEMQLVDLSQLAGAGMQSAAPAAADKAVQLEQRLGADAKVRGDPARLQQVVANLLANAMKFTPQGGRITVHVERSGAHVKMTVRDSGIGIAPDFLPFVFERFRQGDATRTRRHGGLGLGLSIVRHLVELHGGTVSAHSAGPGLGATFVVSLPHARASTREAEMAAAADPHDALAGAADFAGMRILAVDDEQDARDLVRHLLEQQGAEVRTAANAPDALAAVENFRPDLLLSDIGMPGMDGYELIRRVRRMDHGDVHAIAISAYARADDRSRAMDAGYDAYLVKPLHPASLLRAVSYFVARTRRGAAAQSRKVVERTL